MSNGNYYCNIIVILKNESRGSNVETSFTDLVSFLDFSPWIPLGTFSILLFRFNTLFGYMVVHVLLYTWQMKK